MHRRDFLKLGVAGAASLAMPRRGQGAEGAADRPNIILLMSDDQGWGDVAYNGNPIVQTPYLDDMARECLRLDRFYSAAPVCSPTRGSCLTGRHPYRYGIPWANEGRLPREEVTLAEALKQAGYRTGHFGKWHIGGLTTTVKDGIKGGPGHPEEYSPPWENGFDVCFAQELGGPTFNPTVWGQGEYETDSYEYFMQRPVKAGETADMPGVYPWPSVFWTGPGQIATDNLGGDSSRVIIDRAIAFIEQEIKANNPFLSVIWFNTPHSPIAAGDEHRRPYLNLSIEEQHWYGCLTAMDEQIGRLRTRLRELSIAENSIVWFCSDNGPSWIHDYNSAGPFRGKKGTLYEGGIRVPAVVEWPAKIKVPRAVDIPCSTSDFYPTFLAAAGCRVVRQPLPIDGINLLPLIEGDMTERPSPIAFQSPAKAAGTWRMDPASKQLALSNNRYKLYSGDGGKTCALYDLVNDKGETTDLAKEKPELVKAMRAALGKWVQSCERSSAGKDYV